MPVAVSQQNGTVNEISVFKKIAENKQLKLKERSIEQVWNKKVPDSEIEKFTKIVQEKYNIKLDSYGDLHRWSVENYEKFWEEVWHYFGIVSSTPFDEVFVKTGPGFLDNEWFVGAQFNFAENILRIRDERTAIIQADEKGSIETITFAEMFEEVKLYAAAFRKNGLKKGDTVACYMSNRKEALYAMLAAASIGAVWGGPQPFSSAKTASKITSRLEAKFLITVDHHTLHGDEFYMLENLDIVINNTPTLEKVIIVVTQEENLSKYLSRIRNREVCCLLEEFLDTGRLSDGTVPDVKFEQLPPNHPVFVSFSSGTTGLPKGPVHTASSLLAHMVDIGLHWNLKCGDTLFSPYAMGWTLWNAFMPCLALGVKLFLYSGCPFYTDGEFNFWDYLSKHKVTYTFMVTSFADRMEKVNLKPKPNSSFEHLRMIMIGGSPVKNQNFKYVRSIVGDDVFIGSMYGATETCSTFSGVDLNSPVYAGEIQVPALGKDLQCFDTEGNSKIGERGELVVTIPSPSFPAYLWKDTDNKIVKSNYFSKYPDVWCQNDECWINPITKGIVVIGRSDDTITQNGERFGAEDIYSAIHGVEEILDYLCVGQNRYDGDMRAILFVKMREGYEFNSEFKKKFCGVIQKELWEECIPELILEVKDIPYNLNNKKMESIVRKIVATNQLPEASNIKNPECLKYFINIPEIVHYNED